MAFSETVSQTVFNTRRVIDSAMRRCKIPAQTISGEHLDIAKNQLYLFLSDLANQGTPLWCVQKTIYPLYDGAPTITTYSGTVDLLNGNYRRMSAVTGTNTDTATTRTIDFTDATTVATVGVLWAAAAVPVALERSDDDVTWTTVQVESPTASSGDITWFDLESLVAAQYFRIRATSGTLSFTDIYTLNTPYEVSLARMNRDDYANLPDKTRLSNQPLQYWLDRQAVAPVMNLWPVPDGVSDTCQVVVWAQRHIMDVGTLAQEIEAPQRWYEAIVSGLAAKLAIELVEASPDMVPILDARAAEALYKAQAEERDNSPFNLMPAIGAYTR